MKWGLTRAQRQRDKYIRGYDWAAGALLRGEENVITVLARTFGPQTDEDCFDRGARDATKRLAQSGILDNPELTR